MKFKIPPKILGGICLLYLGILRSMEFWICLPIILLN